MTNKYNVLVNYNGDGDFKFAINGLGEVSISKDKPIYIQNATLNTIEGLRVLRRMLIEIKIGVKPDGAYKIYNLEEVKSAKEKTAKSKFDFDRRGTETVSTNEISSILKSGNNGPIVLEEDQVVSITPTNDVEDEEIVEEVIINEKTEKTSTKKNKGTKKNKKSSKK